MITQDQLIRLIRQEIAKIGRASPSRFGLIKLGDGLTMDDDGRVNVTGGGGVSDTRDIYDFGTALSVGTDIYDGESALTVGTDIYDGEGA